MKVNIEGKKIIGIFERRVNRFVAEVIIDDVIQIAHVANTGRMKELLKKGAIVVLRENNEPHRKTKYDLLMVYIKDILVAIDSKFPNILLYQGFLQRDIPHFHEYHHIRKEVTFGNSKFDLSLSNDKESVLIEAKCVTLVKNNRVASFPDAPTERGRKHILELIEAKKQGYRAAVFFILQRNDSKQFIPNKEMDKNFNEAVLLAKSKGVEFYGYNCEVTMNTIKLKEKLQIMI